MHLGRRLFGHFLAPSRYLLRRMRSAWANQLCLTLAPYAYRSGKQAASPRMIMLSGEPHSAGHTYRIRHMAETLRALGWEVEVWSSEKFRWRLYRLSRVSWVHAWRMDVRWWGQDWVRFLGALKRWDIRFSYDLDDYLFDPALMTPEMMDWMRLLNAPIPYMRAVAHYQQTLVRVADCFTAPTDYLVEAARDLNRFCLRLQNGYDSYTKELCDQLRAQPRPQDGLIRIGYAGGSLSHQRDFLQAMPALAKVLSTFPQVRLVIFGRALKLDEFPDLLPFLSQIEDREWVPKADLPKELWRFDINIAPLELNLFCQAKSELKYFEAALLGVPTVASPTEPFQQAITHRQNGLLAHDTKTWETALTYLITHPQERVAMGEAARLHAQQHFGPEARALAVKGLIEHLGLAKTEPTSPLHFSSSIS